DHVVGVLDLGLVLFRDPDAVRASVGDCEHEVSFSGASRRSVARHGSRVAPLFAHQSAFLVMSGCGLVKSAIDDASDASRALHAVVGRHTRARPPLVWAQFAMGSVSTGWF